MDREPRTVSVAPKIYQTVTEGDRGATLGLFALDEWHRDLFATGENPGEDVALYWRINPDGERYGFEFRVLSWAGGGSLPVLFDDPNADVCNVCFGYACANGIRHSWWGSDDGWLTFRPATLAAVLSRIATLESIYCDRS